ncbi:MAG: hypothetical protein J7K34_10565 [Flavobacteriaceae bacterium]|nr:hypothetical protein [Flavobacteriaceae bacterium]
MFTKKILIISNIIFVVIISILVYILLFMGTEMVKLPDDNRIIVKYEPDLRDLVLNEMRDYLEVMNEIQQGLAENDPDKIVKAATRQGQVSLEATPLRLLKLSPLACKQMGFRGHDIFQAIADSARINFKRTTTINQLAELTNNCIVCHRTYRIKLE